MHGEAPMHSNIYEQGLSKNGANHAALSPLGFLERSASVYPERVAVVHGHQRFTWSQVYERSKRLASALTRLGVKKGDTVAVMLPNIPAM